MVMIPMTAQDFIKNKVESVVSKMIQNTKIALKYKRLEMKGKYLVNRNEGFVDDPLVFSLHFRVRENLI